MLVLDNTDVLEGGASVASVVDYTFHGMVGSVLTQLAAGTLSDTLTAVLYTAGDIVVVSAITLVNTHSAAVNITLRLDPANGAAPRYIIPKTVSLGIGYSLHTDGVKLAVFDANGILMQGMGVSDTAYAVSWDGVTNIAPSKNAVYDQMVLKAPLISPALVTPALGTPSAAVLTNATGLPTAGLATQVFAAGIGIGGAAADTGGVAFPSTAVPSSDAYTLDHYEEGGYTVALTCSTSGSVTINTSYDTLAYTKTGRVVYIGGQFRITSVSSPVGYLRVSVPFAATALEENSDWSSFGITYEGIIAVGLPLVGRLVGGSSSVTVFEQTTTGIASSAENIQAGSEITISGVYFSE